MNLAKVVTDDVKKTIAINTIKLACGKIESHMEQFGNDFGMLDVIDLLTEAILLINKEE